MRRFIIAATLLAALPAHAEEDVVAKLQSTPASLWDIGAVRFQHAAAPKIDAIAKERGYTVIYNYLSPDADGRIGLSLGIESDQVSTSDRIKANCTSILNAVRRDVFLIKETDPHGDENARNKYAAFFSSSKMSLDMFEKISKNLWESTVIILGIDEKNLTTSCSQPLAWHIPFVNNPSPN